MVRPSSYLDSLPEFSAYQHSREQAEKMQEHFLRIAEAGVGSLVDIEGFPSRVGLPHEGSRGIRLMPYGSILTPPVAALALLGHELLTVDSTGTSDFLVVGARPGLGATAEIIEGKRGTTLYFPLHRIVAFNYALTAQD